jgi:hypothetical protein
LVIGVKLIKVYLNTYREREIFYRIKEALGEDDTGTFMYVLKAYAERHNLISEALHK